MKSNAEKIRRNVGGGEDGNHSDQFFLYT